MTINKISVLIYECNDMILTHKNYKVRNKSLEQLERLLAQDATTHNILEVEKLYNKIKGKK